VNAQSSSHLRRPAKGECVLLEDRWSCWPEAVDTAHLVDEREVTIYSLACEHFRHDLTQFWNHSSLFALLQVGLISVAVTSLGPQDKEKAPGVLDPWQVAASIAVVGLLFAIFWCMVAWRRSVLIQRWREQVTHLDGRVNPHAMYLRVETDVAQFWWYGPTKLTMALPFLVAAVWLVLLSALACKALAFAVLAGELVVAVWIVVASWIAVRRSRHRPY
jgi:hypothetical protein